MLSLLIYLLLLLLLLCGSAFFSGSEMAFNASSKLTLNSKAESGDARAQAFCRFLNDSEHFLGTVLVGNNLVNVSLVTIGQILVAQYIVDSAWFQEFVSRWPGFDSWNEVLTTLLITPVVLIYCEILPKAVVRNRADGFALLMARPMELLARLLAPVTILVTAVSRRISRHFGQESLSHSVSNVTREDLKVMARMAAEQGMVAHDAGAMLQMVLELDQKPVETVMIPLVEIRSLALNARVEDVQSLTAETGYSRFPVYDGRINEIVGVVSLRQIMASPKIAGMPEEVLLQSPIAAFVDRNISYVPESKGINELLFELRYQDLPLAVVVDEYGGMIGMVTVEDLAEQIVGNIQGEKEQESLLLQRIGSTAFECDGRLGIRELERSLGFRIDNQGYETAAGLILKLAGRIPKAGDSFRFHGCTVAVLEVKHHRISKLRFTLDHDRK
ncbi:MAG: HlyC/CorC family transporter [Oligosphaeraceae bacterium]|nr:HlyC/CorC family transporter [Oligosphaeraceae bacterium]